MALKSKAEHTRRDDVAEQEAQMDELIAQLETTVGIDREKAEQAVSIILGFLKQAGPPDKVSELMEKLPGADTIETPSGGMGGMMGAMAAFNSLQSAGLGMGEIQGVTRQLVAYAKQHAGDELVDEVVGAIPGLSQFA
jgi:Protein of unknown function VcgC/VcgE (DUF2780)